MRVNAPFLLTRSRTYLFRPPLRVCLPPAIFGVLGGTTAVVIAFIAPSIFWERFVGFMYPWRHPRKLFARFLLGFAAFVAALSLPSVLIDLLGDLYATTWWVPVYTGSANFGHWEGGIKTLAEYEAVAAPAAGRIGAAIGSGALSRVSPQPVAVPEVVSAAASSVLSALNRSTTRAVVALERAHGKPSASKSNASAPMASGGSGRAPLGAHQHPPHEERAGAGAAVRPTPPKRRKRRV